MTFLRTLGFVTLIGCTGTTGAQIDLTFVPANFPNSDMERLFDDLPPGERDAAIMRFNADMNGYYSRLQPRCTALEAALLTEMTIWFGYFSSDLPRTPAVAAYLAQREPEFGAVDPDFRVPGKDYGGPQGPSRACLAAADSL